MPARVPRSFFDRPTLAVARAMLGCRLVRRIGGRRVAGRIVEVEAYIGAADLACHGRFGPTARNAVMFGPAGVAYVYFTYGRHWMFNIVTERQGLPAAVLIRALEPLEGIDRMQRRRGLTAETLLCSGPARLTQALQIDRAVNGSDLCARDSPVWLEAGPPIPARRIGRGPRIGVEYAPEPWRSRPWRFLIKDSPFVSR